MRATTAQLELTHGPGEGTTKPRHERTGLETIPNEWKVLKIGELCALINGRGFKPHEWRDSGLPIIRIQNLNGSDEFNYFDGAYNPKLLVDPGQLLFAWSGSRGTSFGPHFWRGSQGLLNYHTWKVVPNEAKVDRIYFFHALRQLTALIEDKAHGASALVHMQKWEMEGLYIAIPPIPEQRAAAEALSDVDSLLGALEALIVKKRATGLAAMQQLLTGKTRLPGFSGEWETKPFGAVLDRINAKDCQVQTSEYQAMGRYPVIDQGQTPIVGFSDRDEKRFTCPDGGVIVFGDHTCVVKYIDFDFVVGADGTQIVQAKSGQCTRYYAYLLRYRGIRPTGYNRHFRLLSEREFLVPPYTEQTAIADALSDIDAEIESLERRLEKTGAIKKGMMQQLLTGRVRLVEPEALA